MVHSYQIMIRLVRREDVPVIVRLEELCFKVVWPESVFYSFVGHPGFVLFEKEGHVAGYTLLVADREWAHLANLATCPCHRRQGVASVLLNYCEKLSAANMFSRIRLEVRENNCAARKFYAARGFEQVDMIPDYYLDDNAVVMEKTI